MKKIVLQALKKHVKISGNILEIPPEQEMGDVSLPCFKLSKQLKKSAQTIAVELKTKIKSPNIEKIEVKSGYLNFFLNKEKTSKKILNKKYKPKNKGRIMVEYANLNTHKDMHIGHLKNMAMGEALSRILSYTGYTVIPSYYINDYGLHVAKVLWYLKKYKPKTPTNNHAEWLGQIYTKAHFKTKENINFEKETKKTLELMEKKDVETLKLWKKTWKQCINDFEKIFKEMDLKIEVKMYEHEYYDKGKKIVDEMLKKGIAEHSEGAVIINMKKYGLGTMLLVKSDGNTLYATADLALAKHKFNKYKLDKSIYVVGSEQNHYFKQLFKALELYGFKQEMIHATYGLFQLKTGKMSSRLGTVITYSELTKKMKEKSLKETLKRNPKMNKTKARKISEKIAFGALKYDVLKTDNKKLSIFDWENALSLEGDTAPYVQYACVRAKKILKKSRKKPGKLIEINSDEYALVKKIGEFEEMINMSAEKLAQNLLANYAHELAQLFNTFYNKCKVIGHELEEQRLLITQNYLTIIEKTLQLLGIQIPERM